MEEDIFKKLVSWSNSRKASVPEPPSAAASSNLNDSVMPTGSDGGDPQGDPDGSPPETPAGAAPPVAKEHGAKPTGLQSEASVLTRTKISEENKVVREGPGTWIVYIVLTVIVAGATALCVSDNLFGALIGHEKPSAAVAVAQEQSNASLAHLMIVMPLLNCYPSQTQELSQLRNDPTLVDRTFLYSSSGGMVTQAPPESTPQNNQQTTTNGDTGGDAKSAVAEDLFFGWRTLPLATVHRQAVDLSSLIARGRIDAAARAASAAGSNFQTTTWIILLGAATTILVGIRAIISTSGVGAAYVGVLAIVVSAANTAFGGLNALYGPGQELAAANQSLSLLRRGHVELVSVVTNQKDICHNGEDDDFRKHVQAVQDKIIDALAP